jgi:hypothetical protein
MTHTAEPMTLAQLIVRDVCETDPADPDQAETICINASHLETIISSRIDAELAKQRETEPVGYRYRHSEQESWHFGPYPKSWWECQPLYTHPQQRNAVEMECTCSAKDMPFGRCCKVSAVASRDREDAGYYKWRLDEIIPLFEEARDALPAISKVSRRLHGIDPLLADRMDKAGCRTREEYLAARRENRS